MNEKQGAESLRAAVDLIQSRYGWTDEYVLHTLSAERVVQLYTDILRYKQQEDRELVEKFALAAYLQTPNESKMTFERYLISVGIKEKEKVGVEEALKRSEEVLAMFREE